MKKLSKLLALALALCLIFSCISVVAFAAETDSYEDTIFTLNSANDVTNYTWAGNAATGTWDATENAFKFVSNGASTGTRFQTNYHYFRLVQGAKYTLTLKVKGIEPTNVGVFVTNSNDSAALTTSTGYWKDASVPGEKRKGAEYEDGYTEWTYDLDFDSVISNKISGERLAYSGVVRFFVNMPNNEKYTAYVKDLKLVANKSQGEAYVTSDYMFLNQNNITGVPLFRYASYCYTDPVVSADTDGDRVWNLALQKEKLLLGEAYTFDANTKYRLSFDAWLDESCPGSYESSSNTGILFDSAANKYTQVNFTLAKTRKHFDLVFDTATLGEASAFSTANLQLRIGDKDKYPANYIFNITDIRLQKFTTNTVDTLVKVNGAGTVKKTTQYTTYAFANGESLPVVSGTPVTLDVAPNSGYQIASITYNNEDITPADREAASQITITPTSDAVLNVKFEVIPPKIPTLVKGANQKAESFTIGGTVYNNVNYIQYAKIDNYSALDVESAGVTLSDGTDSLDLPAVSVAADGSFAIRVFGDAITADGTYTFTPYMVTK